MSNSEHAARLRQMADDTCDEIAFLRVLCDQGTRFEPEESDLASLRAGATALDEVAALRADEKMHVEVIGDLMAQTTTLKAEIEQLQEANRWRPIAEAHEEDGPIVLIDIKHPGRLQLSYGCSFFWPDEAEGMTHFSKIAPLTYQQADALIAALPDPPEGA